MASTCAFTSVTSCFSFRISPETGSLTDFVEFPLIVSMELITPAAFTIDGWWKNATPT
uniref:Uncharacterized protein n=1 Tax=Medicago truncatula TaxID=3880 RepID=A2Q4X3_MEDTR|nr:hypothetical protein MtrDRAFT_AC157893g42v2 [Medicago truncatula]